MAGLVLLATVVAVVLLVDDEPTVLDPGSPPTTTASGAPVRGDAAGELLRALTAALTEGSRKDAIALAAPGEPTAAEALGTVHDNVREVGVEDLSLRFVDEDESPLTQELRRELGPRSWGADVAVSWRIAGFDQASSRMEVAFTLVDTPDGIAFGAVGGDEESAAPLWMLDDLAVVRTGRTLVMVAGGDRPGRFAGLAARAVRDVRAVLPRWDGRLVVEVPATQRDVDRTLGVEPGTYESIAAITATVDGSHDVDSPTHIVVNPRVFSRLGPEGSQIVMSHEATHVATQAATSTMPLWLLEGFADYVALARTELPVSVTASQILAQVRRDGPPRSLPGRAEFDPEHKLLGTSYEAAWLAARLIAESYGERSLLAFYDAVDDGRSVTTAFREVLGTTQGAFTARWRDYLQQLAA